MDDVSFADLSIDDQDDSKHLDEAFLQELYTGQSFVKDETRIVLIGKTGSGKSATGNNLAGREAFESLFSGSSVTRQCRQVMVRRFDRHIQIVDTPGLFDTGMSLEQTSREIMKCVAMTSPGIHVLVLVTRLNRYTKEEEDTVKHFVKVFGKGVLKYLLVLFTGKDELDNHKMTIENFVRTSPRPLQNLVTACGGRYHAVNNLAPADEKEKWAKYFLEEVDKLVARNGGHCYTSEMYRQAEKMMKKREEEVKKKIEEEKRAERELIERNIKAEYDEVTRKHEENIHQLQIELNSVAKKGEEDQKKYQDTQNLLQRRLKEAEEEKAKIEQDRQKWEQERQWNDQAMMMKMNRLEDQFERREYDLEERMERINDSRKEKKAEIKRLEKENEKIKREYEKKLSDVEKNSEKENERLRKQIKEWKDKQEEEARRVIRRQVEQETGPPGILGSIWDILGPKYPGPPRPGCPGPGYPRPGPCF